jgi:hypothetical protein
MNLYELSNRFQQLLDQDELSEEDCKELDQIFADGEEQCISYAKYIRNKQAELAAVEAARKEMQEREKKLTAKIERQENWLLMRMKELKFSKIMTPQFPIIIRTNPVSVCLLDGAVIPEKFWVTKVTETKTLDKAAVKAAIQAGETVPGADLAQKLRIDFK